MAYAKKSPKLTGIRNTIITVILLAMITVVLAVLAVIFNTPERVVKSKIESIAADYYENFFYQSIVEYKTTQKELEKTMQKYEKDGFSRITLQQLLLYDNQKHADAAETLKNYCNESETAVTIYPKAPYGQKDYHVEYDYSCEF